LLSGLAEYAKLEYTDPCGYTDREIRGVSSVSYKTKRGDIFFAIEGSRSDGHSFVDAAIKNGAFAVCVKKGRGKEFSKLAVPFFESANPRASLAYALDAVCGFPSQRAEIIAVTGTNGKTSISFMLRAMLERAGYKCALAGTLGCFIGEERVDLCSDDPLANMTTPDPSGLYPFLALACERNASYIIMEASSHASALSKLAPLKFRTAVFSNLTPEHLDFHKSMENYFSAKLDILRHADKCIVNADTPYLGRILSDVKRENITLVSNKDDKYDFFVENITQNTSQGIEFNLREGEKIHSLSLNLPGSFNAENASLAFACARGLGIDSEICLLALKDFCGVPGRMQRVALNAELPFSVFIDYAHTPDALEKVLGGLRDDGKRTERIVLLFGCGGDRDKSKRPQMAKIAARLADFTVVTSDNPRGESRDAIISDILSGFEDGFSAYTVIPDRGKAIEYVVENARAGDVIILAGKGHEKYEIDPDGRRPFDEEETVKRSVRKYIKKNLGA